MKRIIQYETQEGEVPFRAWLLAFKDATVRARIRTRMDRLLLGNFGDCKPVGGGVSELRLHFGPGYRVYFGIDHDANIILLLGGDKSKQERDICRAQQFWADHLRRSQ